MTPREPRLPSVNALRAFAIAGRHRSFAAAAAELAVSPGAVSRQVIALEAALGLRLFLRHAGGIALTESGRAYHVRIAAAFDNMLAATRALFEPLDPGCVTISVVPTFAMRWLVPRLSHFSRLHPGISVEIITGDGTPEPDGRWDLAIRYGDDVWPGFDAVRLLDEEMVVVCAPSVAHTPLHLEDIPATALLKHLTRPHAWKELFSQEGLAAPVLAGGRGFDHLFMLVEAARLGQGFALVPRYVVGNELAAGSLVQPVPGFLRPTAAYFVLQRHGPLPPAVKVVFEWLKDEAASK